MADGRRSPQSALFKAASEPDLTLLPDLFLDYPAVPSPPQTTTRTDLHPMIADAEAYNISVQRDPAPLRGSPSATPPMSPGRSSPIAISRHASPSPPSSSPVLPFPSSGHSVVSFSEYVATELARDQNISERYGVSFVAASKPSASSAVPQIDLLPLINDPTPSDRFHVPSQSPEASRRVNLSDILRSDSDPVIPSASSEMDHAIRDMDAVGPEGVRAGRQSDDIARMRSKGPLDSARTSVHAPKPSPGLLPDQMGFDSNMSSGTDSAFQNGSTGRWGKLDCYQLDEKGEVTLRQLSRAEILQEARETLNHSQPSPKAVGRWLSDADQSPSAELQQFANLLEPETSASRKATQKALRDYLRNSLQARDIRQVDPAFVAKPALWVRHSAIVVSLEGLRAIILHNKMFLFDPFKDRTRNLVFIAKQSILVRPDAENPQPFEFKALEGILIFLAMGLEREFEILKPAIEEYLHQLPNELTTKMLEGLRLKKQQLNDFHSRASNVKNILENLLDEDEDMANMYLSEKHRSRNQGRSSVDHNEVETLLEAYLQVIDELVNHATLLNNAIDDTEDLVMIHLDTLRNRLLSVELALSVVGMTFGFGGVVAGVFGMNLQIPPFQPSASGMWFLLVALVIVISVVAASWLALVGLRRRGLYSFYFY